MDNNQPRNLPESKNEIVVYQPDDTIRLAVRLENETVWLTQAQLCELFQRDVSVISRHIKNIFSECELDKESNLHYLQIATSDRPVALYSLDVIISVGYRVKSVIGTRFRQWANRILKEYVLRGYAVNERFARLEQKVLKHEEQINLVLQTALPPIQGVFYDGQLWDARALVLKLVSNAKRSIVLIDNWATPETLDLLAKKGKGVKVTVFTSEHYDKKHAPHHKISPSDITTFNTQYPKLAVRYSEAFHDRFLVIDDKELYLINAPKKRGTRFEGEIRRRRTRRAHKRPRASLKDLGRKCFAFTKLDSGEIPRIKKVAFSRP